MYKPVTVLLAAITLAALVYWPGLGGPLVVDDHNNLKTISEWLSGDRSWLWVVFGNSSGPFGRPVSMATFVANIALLGPSVWGLKLGNLLLHLINGALVYLFLQQLHRWQRDTTAVYPSTAWIPLLGAAIWLLHPLFVSTVLYVVQRMAMLSATFTLLALIAYAAGRVALERGDRRRGWLLLGAAAPSAMVLAVFSKESGLLVPALCGVLELFLFAPPAGQRRTMAAKSFIALTLVMPAILVVGLTLTQAPIIADGYQIRSFTLTERILTQPRVLWDYVGSLVLPQGPRLGLYHDDYVVSTGLLSPATTALAIAAWLATLAVAWRVRKIIPGLSIGVGLFLVGHAMESSVFSLLMYFEHRNYLPAIGVVWALVSLGAWVGKRLSNKLDHGRAIGVSICIALPAVLALATLARAGIWGNEDLLLEQSLRYHPNSVWLRTDLAQRNLRQAPPQYADARAWFAPLLDAPRPETRRLASTWQLLIDCASGTGASQRTLEGAFAGTLTAFEPDQLLAYEAIADGVRTAGCRNLTPSQLAGRMIEIVESTSIESSHYHLRRMRFKAAQLLARDENYLDAFRQAKAADAGDADDTPIAAFAAELALALGMDEEAETLINRLDRQIRPDDRIGSLILEALHAKRSATTESPDNSQIFPAIPNN